MLVSTIFRADAVFAAVTKLSPDRLIIVYNDDPTKSREKDINDLHDAIAKVKDVLYDPNDEYMSLNSPVEEKPIELYDLLQTTKTMCDLIDEEHEKGNRIMFNMTGGRKTIAYSMLYAALSRKDKVDRVVYMVRDSDDAIDLPLISLDFGLSPKKRKMLEVIKKKSDQSVESISKSAGIASPTAYVYIRELEAERYVRKVGTRYKITVEGELAISIT